MEVEKEDGVHLVWAAAGLRAVMNKGMLDNSPFDVCFTGKASAALPVTSGPSLEDVYAALGCARFRLQHDLQVPEWTYQHPRVCRQNGPIQDLQRLIYCP